ncbi:hypothetical protein EQG68_13130 [Flavobacterium piscinae]|uniref:DUF1735 domain-containing protein n=1 Tax=Flavobacterium piscinae TaxID=2506424 RepID=A0A4Q1KI19_9FLAO|nr:hypothetical protein [Flavobacterium piscinae]RXR29423.1 hypothetical protein EQG68_13130 [Flavobacterium piscinae]
MKRILLFNVAMLSFLFLGSCQEEENTIVQDTTENLNGASPVSKFLARAAQNNTSVDNVMDETSVFRLKLPVDINLNDVNITVATEADYATVADLKNASNSDDDIVTYVYPITVSLRNFEEITVNNLTQLNTIITQNEDLSDISCVTIVYPITINEYDSANQLADILTINSDSQLINYLLSLNNGVFYSINYPISVINPNNQNVVINSNIELRDVIENAIGQCGSNSGSTDDFIDVLTSGNWRISYYHNSDEDDTSVYNGYVFTFNANNTITITRNSSTFTGTWLFYEEDGVDLLEIDFQDDPLDDLDDDWELLEFSSTLIQLKEEGDDEYLSFTKI